MPIVLLILFSKQELTIKTHSSGFCNCVQTVIPNYLQSFNRNGLSFCKKSLGVINAFLLILSFTFPENWWNRTVTAAVGYRVYPQQIIKSLPKQATCRNLINWFIAKIVSMRLLLLLSHTTCFNRRTQRCQPVHQRQYFLAYKPVSFPDESWL